MDPAETQNHLFRTLHAKEHEAEDAYFTARDRELIARLHAALEEEHREIVRELARSRCPECGARLQRHAYLGVTVDACPTGHGMWMTEGAMHTIARREHGSWISRYLYRPRPVV